MPATYSMWPWDEDIARQYIIWRKSEKRRLRRESARAKCNVRGQKGRDNRKYTAHSARTAKKDEEKRNSAQFGQKAECKENLTATTRTIGKTKERIGKEKEEDEAIHLTHPSITTAT